MSGHIFSSHDWRRDATAISKEGAGTLTEYPTMQENNLAKQRIIQYKIINSTWFEKPSDNQIVEEIKIFTLEVFQ